ncbi:MAG: histidinol-phosphatase HisJ family protein [Lachnospiraceae bacterium]|nr:histidinol-phosphatase HisJ family protein [Lachnospiraceae bacterium]
MKKYLADYHVHTEFSDDSVCPMEKMIQRGIELGLNEICFTDHVDYGIKLDWGEIEGECRLEDGIPVRNVDYAAYFRKIEQLQKQYKDIIQIRKGLEFGIQTGTIPQYEALFHQYQLDFVILSIHEIGNQEFWNQDYQSGRCQKELNDTYYEELYRVICQYQNYSVLGHLDLIKRYDPFGIYPFENNCEIITKILQKVIEDGKGIEVNTSSFYYKLPDLQPCTEILRLYRELGGTIITIGSDAHKSEFLADHIEDVKQKLRELGYTQFCIFEKMKPIFHPLN